MLGHIASLMLWPVPGRSATQSEIHERFAMLCCLISALTHTHTLKHSLCLREKMTFSFAAR